jgi:eukaryotic-like serine/threonine-protein kinase
MAAFTVPGFEVGERLAGRLPGERWSAHGRATGRPVVLCRLPIADDVATHDQVRRAAARLVGVAHPHLVALRGVLSVEGAVVLVHDQVPGVHLDDVLDERALTADQVVTLLVPLAQALAALGEQGLVHGRVSPATVLVADDGRPMLIDAGLAACLDAPGREHRPPDDVRDLALTGLAALHLAASPGPLSSVLTAATLDDEAHRPRAAELAAAVFATGPAAPIRDHGPTGPAAPAGPGSAETTSRAVARGPGSHRRPADVGAGRRVRRRWAALLVALAAAAAAALTGLAWAAAQPADPGATVARGAPAPSYAAASEARRWRSVLVGLDDRRASAFATASPRRLSDVYAAGAPALRRDTAQLVAMVAAGLHVDRVQLRPRSVRVVAESARRVELAVVDVLDPYAVRDARGALVTTRPGRGPASWRVSLVRGGSGWRVYDVVAS